MVQEVTGSNPVPSLFAYEGHSMEEESAKQTLPFVQPRVLKGFQDTLPEDAIVLNDVVGKVCKVLERFGFLPIDTPALEYLTVLLGTAGEETTKQIFRLKSPEHEDIALRFDLTVPFARFMAGHLEELKLPFRRYHVAPVWRADKPGTGRFREFTQLDFDAAGSPDMAVDAEVIRLVCDVMTEINVPEYQVLVNHRKIMDALLQASGIASDDERKHVLRVIDKLVKVGIDEVRKELGEGRVDESGDRIKGVGLDTRTIDFIVGFLNISANTRQEVLEGIQQVLPATAASKEATEQAKSLLNGLESLGVPEDPVSFAPSLARGLDYYTGPIFEVVLPGASQFGSVVAGGRYDGLVKRFLGIDIPATGGSIGISRFLSALKAIGAFASVKSLTQVLVTVMQPKYMSHYLSLSTELRAAGINTEVYFGGAGDTLSAQLAMANRRQIPIAVIMGEDEIGAGSVAVKDLRAGRRLRKDVSSREEYVAAGKAGQTTVSRDECVGKIREMLGT